MNTEVLTTIHENVLTDDVLAHTIVWKPVPAAALGSLYAAMYTHHCGTQLMCT